MDVAKITLRKTIIIWVVGLIVITVPAIISMNRTVREMICQCPILLYLWGQDSIFFFLQFFVVSISYGWIYFCDKKNGYIEYIKIRVSIKKYRRILLITCAVMAFSCVFIKERILYYRAMSLAENILIDGNDYTNGMLFRYLLNNNPYIYSLLYAVWQGIIFAAYAIFAVVLSFYVKNFFVIATSAILYHFIEDLMVLKNLFYPAGSIIFTRGFHGFAGKYVNAFTISLGLIIFILFIIGINYIGTRNERKEIL